MHVILEGVYQLAGTYAIICMLYEVICVIRIYLDPRNKQTIEMPAVTVTPTCFSVSTLGWSPFSP